jgi:hypothetical protein
MGNWLVPRAVWALVALAVLLALSPRPADARMLVAATGPAEIVFLHDRDACRPEDIPDEPARAFRDSARRVHLFTSHYLNFGFVGPDLNSVKRDCRLSFQGAGSDDPARFDDHEWLTSFWTEDGNTVHALVHNEFQGNLRPALCPTRRYFDCWYNAIVAAVSTDGGFHFTRQEPAIVAAPASRYDPSVGHPVGYFNASNIIKRGGYYYVMVFAEPVGGQKRGNCLLRTDDLSRADSWRAWDGSGFTIRLASPYAAPAGEGCTLVAPDRLTAHIWSLVLYRPTGHYLAVTEQNGPRPAFVVAESADLLNWSEPEPILDDPVAERRCKDHPLRAYPSWLDPDSPSRNFDTVGRTAYLYFTRLHFGPQCQGTLNRDLMRVPFSIQPGD